MSRLVFAALAAASLVAAAAPAAAQNRYYIEAHEQKIVFKIDKGIRSGSLTPHEAAKLRANLAEIRGLERYYRRTAGLSEWERRDLDRRLDALDRRVFINKHDWQRRWR